jgi:hypothetical protein
MNTFDEDMLEFWAGSHEAGGIERLSCHSLDTHLASLRVELPSGSSSILCVGIGDGRWVSNLVDLSPQYSVWTLDIVQKSIAGATSRTDPASLPSDWFDLAMSLWVAPHMSDEGLAAQLRCVIQSLKRGGVFAIQYNEPTAGWDVRQDIYAAQAGQMVRSRGAFLKMVADSGGRAEFVFEEDKPQYAMRIVVAHIRRQL